MSFELTILGCNSAIPTNDRKPTAQLLNVAERFFLIDCVFYLYHFYLVCVRIYPYCLFIHFFSN